MILDAPSKSPYIALYDALSQRGQELMDTCNTMDIRLPAFDTRLFLEIYMQHFNLACNPPAAHEYLQSKGLTTYDDLLEMHRRITHHLSQEDDESRLELERKIAFPDNTLPPEFQGDGRQFLGVFDFMVAISHIPHSPDPGQPTIMGLMLSTTQSILRDELFFNTSPLEPDVRRNLHHNLLHLLVGHGTLLSAMARTTTGQSLHELHATPEMERMAEIYSSGIKNGSANVLLDGFAITNAIPIHPQYILLTGQAQTTGQSSPSSTVTVHVACNALDPHQTRLVSPSGESSLSLSFSPPPLRHSLPHPPPFYSIYSRMLSNSGQTF